MVVKWLGNDFALDILAVFPLYGHLDCLFCCIIHRQVSRRWGDVDSPLPFAFYSLCYFSSIFYMRLECLGSTSLYAQIKKL